MHHDAFKVNLLLSLANAALHGEVLQTFSSSVTASTLQPRRSGSGASHRPALPQLGLHWCGYKAQAVIGVGSEVSK